MPALWISSGISELGEMYSEDSQWMLPYDLRMPVFLCNMLVSFFFFFKILGDVIRNKLHVIINLHSFEFY